ncbi:MAG: hypothetical protein J6S69_01950, partial [Proteobacteria bacterium]|nr:hypothetical protein [Pseudomonadota bacterium]
GYLDVMKRIIISLLACTLLNGCGAIVWGSGYVPSKSASNAEETSQTEETATEETADTAATETNSTASETTASENSGDLDTEGVVLDPAGGHWAFKVEKVVSGYATRSMKYVNANGQEITPVNSRGETVNIFVTSGFVDGVALVAECISLGSDGFCSDWNYGLMRQDGTFAMEMQTKYSMPSYHLFHTYPAVLGMVDNSGKRLSFPMWTGVVDIQASGETKALYSNDRILVSSRETGQMGYVNGRGMLMMNTQYLGASEFMNGKATVFDPKRGFGEIDTAGIYANASYACVDEFEANSKYLQVNKGGECLNPTLDYRYRSYAQQLYFMSDFVTQTASSAGVPVLNCIGGQTGIVLKSDMSKVVVPAEYDYASVVYMPELDSFMAFSEDMVKVYNADGKTIFNRNSLVSVGTICGYDLYLFKNKEGLMGALKKDGTEFLPAKYQELAYDKNSKKLAALIGDEITMFDISALAQSDENKNAACGDGLKMISVNMSEKIKNLEAAKTHAMKAKADWDTQKEEAKKAQARTRAAQQHATMNVAQFRNRVTQEIQENQAQAQIAQEKAAELKKLEQRKTEITAELAKLNEDTRNKFTLAVQNQIRDLKTELSSVEAQLEKLNSGK